jgi:glycosyltransferase involved in cell wall biosynthesis
LVKEADVGVVCLSSKNKTSFVPGKVLGYMAASRPIVAFLNKESDAFEIIKKAGCGYTTRAGEIDKAVEIIRKIYNEKSNLKKIGEAGFKYALNNLTIDVCLKKLEKLF